MTLDEDERRCHACGMADPPGGLRLGTEGGGAEYEWFCKSTVACVTRCGQRQQCPNCEGQGGQGIWWDDDLGIRHSDWVDCSTCGGTGKQAPNEL